MHAAALLSRVLLPLAALFAHGCAPEPAPRRADGVLAACSSGLDHLAALDALDRVVGVPRQAHDYALGVPARFFERGLPEFFRFDAERVFSLGPALVVLSPHQSPATRERLRERGVALFVLHEVRSLTDVEANLRELGAALGNEAAATAAIARLRARCAQLRAQHPARRLSVLPFSDFGAGIWTAGTGTVADLQLELAGAANHAVRLGLTGHVKLEPERLFEDEPDAILCTGAAARSALQASPVMARLAAVRAGRVLEVAPKLLAANTPQLVEGAAALQSALLALLAREHGR